MPVTVELYGIPRQRVGVARLVANGDTLGSVLADLARRFPDFAQDCLANIDGGSPGNVRLQPQFAANLGGERFLCEPTTPLNDGDCLLILSADAGG